MSQQDFRDYIKNKYGDTKFEYSKKDFNIKKQVLAENFTLTFD
jgi:hypothetical protein